MIDVIGNLNTDLHVRFWGADELPDSLSDWPKTFEEFAEVHHLYFVGQGGTATGGDVGWWYGERANLSLLMGAI